MSVPSKAKAIKLDNPAQLNINHQPETKLHRLGIIYLEKPSVKHSFYTNSISQYAS